LHHFYQIHLAASPGHGPDYGHFVSKDFIHWAPLPVAIWNGIDKSHEFNSSGYVTPYDNEAIFTGSGVLVDGAAPDGEGKGIVQIYPGLCNKNDWPACDTGTLLAQAVPADYANDELLVNWTKPSYNPIMENTQRDPSTPWKLPSGEWRLRTYDSKVYGAASDADLLEGKWYEIGTSQDFRTCECPSFYPLPPPTPGFERAYAELNATGDLPTHVHKTSCGGDWWQLGSYVPAAPKTLGTFRATPGWEDVFVQKRIDVGNFYASKDNAYPVRGSSGGQRRINWGWATVPPQSTQTLPREITFNAVARTLEQAPIAELLELRGTSVFSRVNVELVKGNMPLGLANGVAKQSEIRIVFDLPNYAATFGVAVGKSGGADSGVDVSTYMQRTDLPGADYNITHMPVGTDPKTCAAACDADDKCQAWTYVVRGSPVGSGDCCLKSSVPCPVTSGGASASCTSGSKTNQTLHTCGGDGSVTSCTVDYEPPPSSTVDAAAFYNVSVSCGTFQDSLRLLSTETSVEMRMYSDATFVETFFQGGRTVITSKAPMDQSSDLTLLSDVPSSSVIRVASVDVYPIGSIWTTPEAVRKAKRVYT